MKAAAARAGDSQDAVTPSAAALTAEAPPTPLELRQWQRKAQRSVRLAVTGFKDATARFAAGNGEGTSIVTQLTNSCLSQRYIPDMQLPSVLQHVQGLQQAAVAKLQRQQVQQLQQLQEVYEQMEAAVQDMQAAVADVQSHLSPQSPAHLQRSMPVFHTLSLQESASLLHQILEMHQQELQVKHALLESFNKARAERKGSSDTSSSGAERSRQPGMKQGEKSADELKRQMTAAITTWMVQPCVEDVHVSHLLRVLTDEMVGF